MNRQIRFQDVVKYWEYYTLEADACYHRNELKKAGKHFSQTVDLLEPWIEKDDKHICSLVRLFVLSCHNAGHVQNKLNRPKEAEYYYSHAHFRLLSMLSDPARAEKPREGLIDELSTTFRHLKQFLLGQNKRQLAANIREESLRVIQHSKVSVGEDVFEA